MPETSPDAALLEMQAISKQFPGVRALDGVTVSVRAGEIHAICGENGAGKSTLMSILSGIHPFGSYEGSVRFEGHEVQFRDTRDSDAVGIVIIHQELALSPYLSVAENIFLGNEQRDRVGLIDWDRTETEAARLLARVGLDVDPSTAVGRLGVGKQQLVEIAKALSREVKLLILDEPTAALNDRDSEHMLALIRELRASGITCIIISHKLNEITAIADRVTILRDGKTVETLDHDEIDEDRIVRGMVGRVLEHRFPPRAAEVGEEALRIEGWTVHDPDDPQRKIVDDASLFVRQGEVVGLAGLIGAGRTELAMSVFGRSYGTQASGRVLLHGRPARTDTVRRAIASGIAYATEDRKTYGLNLIDTIARNISAAALSKLSRFGLVDETREGVVAGGFVRSMGIRAESTDAIVGQLSGGNQQKVVLSKWLFTEPEVLILDEPTRGVDVGAKSEIYELINQLAESGKAVLMISSELPELLGMCDRTYAMSRGRITGELPRDRATPEALMRLMTTDRLRMSTEESAA